MSGRHGWIIPEIYDGVSIWIEDGKLINRWNQETHERRWRRVQDLIEFHETAMELTGMEERP